MWDVIVHRSLRPLVDELKGKKAGYNDAYKQLQKDPCALYSTKSGKPRPFAYRLSGPLHEKVCGVRLKNNYRLAFTVEDAEPEADYDGTIYVLAVGERDRGHSHDVWEVVHHICGEENPESGHLKPPCCESSTPAMSTEEIQEAMARLNRLRLGR